MRILIVMTIAAVVLVLLSSIRELQAPAPLVGPVSWQQSIAPQVQLGVRDKYGALGRYPAHFQVVARNGGEFRTTKIVTKDNWGFVYFPENFPTYSGVTGQFLWTCSVNGEITARGSFTLSPSGVTVNQY